MPLVERYGGRKVTDRALPGARRTAAETDTSTGANYQRTRGAAAEAAGNAFGGTLERIGVAEYARIQQAERDRADDVALLEAENSLARFEQKALYDPQTGALGVKGKAAMDLPNQIDEAYTTHAGDIEKGLHTDRQREAFAKVKAQHYQNITATVQRHVFGQMQEYEAGELKAYVENKQSLAVANAQDPRRVQIELHSAIDALTKSAPRLGLGPEQLQAQIENVQSATHVGVINELLASGSTKSARIYFEEARGQISGDAIARVEAALKEGTTRQAAQEATDKIVAKGGTLTEQRAAAKAIEDPDVRQATLQAIEHEHDVKRAVEAEDNKARVQAAYNLVDKTHDVRSIAPADWAALDGGTKNAIRDYVAQLAKGTPRTTDVETFYGLMSKAGDDPESFAKENLLKYKAQLDDADFQQLTSLQLSLKKGERTADNDRLEGVRTNKEIIDGTLAQYGYQTTESKQKPAEKRAIAELQRMLDRRVEQASALLKGKKPTNTEIQQMLDGILAAKRPGKGYNFYNILPFGQPFQNPDRRLIDLGPEDIPAIDRQQIESQLRHDGMPVTDETVLDAYIEHEIRK
ncbi:MAG TPA: hypothetical protein VK506_16650 [Conexibacter sp.]|nr:hypothetical protein [Conexibacter sp.]